MALLARGSRKRGGLRDAGELREEGERREAGGGKAPGTFIRERDGGTGAGKVAYMK
jgi:hypothetical protein